MHNPTLEYATATELRVTLCVSQRVTNANDQRSDGVDSGGDGRVRGGGGRGGAA